MTTNVSANQRARELNDVGYEDIIKKKHIVNNIPPDIKQSGQEAHLYYLEPESTRKEAAPRHHKTEEVTATVPEHYIAGRIDREQYFDFGHKYGWFSMFTLHLVGGKWVAKTVLKETDNRRETCYSQHLIRQNKRIRK